LSLSLSFFEILRIAAFIPGYKEGVGQGLIVFLRDGSTVWLNQGLRSFINQLANFFAINLQEARRKFGPLLGQVNLVPLPLSPALLFVPVKVHSPLVSGDPAYGYFRLRSVLRVSHQPAPCTIELEGIHVITVTQSYRGTCRKLRIAKRLEGILFDQYCHSLDDTRQHFFPKTGLSSPSLQENQGLYGIEEGGKEGGFSSMELRNLMEDIVWQRLDEVLAEQKTICGCDQCRMDMVALALNSLPPSYVVTQRGEIYSKADILENQCYVDVVSAITKAVCVVKNKPRHK
jgi:competence protein ComFB